MIQGISKVLVVEDMASQRMAMASLLESIGVEEVHTAEDGLVARKYLQINHRQIDVIITDLQMPNMDGLQLLEYLGEIKFSGCVFICSHMEQKIIDLAIELARRKSIHLIGCIDKTLDEKLIKVMLQRATRVRNEFGHEFEYIKKRELKEALENGCVVPYYQPQIDLATRKVFGFEVLCRLHLVDHAQLLMPDSFIPVANKFGLANLVTFTLMDKTFTELNQLLKKSEGSNVVKHKQDFRLSFNICPSQLDDDELPLQLQKLCENHDIDPALITIEITEADVIETDIRLKNLDRLRLIGFGCSLDDFGMGFTSLRQLHNYPFTEVKFDKSLVLGVDQDHYAQRLCQQLYEISEVSDFNFVIEGVEVPEQASFFERYKKVTLQGFLISRPKPIEEMARWYRAWQKQV